VENLWPFYSTLHVSVECKSRHVALGYPTDSWEEDRDAGPHETVRFREDLVVGTPKNVAMLPYDEDLQLRTTFRRKGPGAPDEAGAGLKHTLHIV
jgi:hypothetical protein